MAAELRFRAMGCDVHVVVVDGPPGALEQARSTVERLERRWSRFLPTSELCRLNAAAGSPVLLATDTYELVAAAVEAWWATAGRFDPTTLGALLAAGYDRPFEQLAAAEPTGCAPPRPAPGCAGIALDPDLGAVTLPAGVALDLGGIAKGHTADVVVDDLLRDGAAGACVNVGGDLRMGGRPPAGHGAWTVAIDDPLRPGADVAIVEVGTGAVATTSSSRRRWRTTAGTAHHVIDPATGAPATSGLASVSVVAGSARTAEVLAKAAFVAGPGDAPALLDAFEVAAVLVDDTGRVTTAGWADTRSVP